jgi:hypothetical protein
MAQDNGIACARSSGVREPGRSRLSGYHFAAGFLAR